MNHVNTPTHFAADNPTATTEEPMSMTTITSEKRKVKSEKRIGLFPFGKWVAVAAAGVMLLGAMTQEAKADDNWGFYNDDRSWITFEINGVQSSYSLWNTTCGTLNGAVIGGVAEGGTLKIVNYDTKTWKSSGGNVTGCEYWYKIDGGTAHSMGGGYLNKLNDADTSESVAATIQYADIGSDNWDDIPYYGWSDAWAFYHGSDEIWECEVKS